MAVEIQIKPMGAKGMQNMNGGQEQEKETIAQLKEMAMQMTRMCDSLMAREQEEDRGENTEGQSDESDFKNKLKEQFAR